MNIVSSTKLRNNFGEVAKLVKEKKYVLVAMRGRVRWAVVDIDYFEKLVSVDRKLGASLSRVRRDFEDGSFEVNTSRGGV